MEKINTKKEILEKLKDLLAVERLAKQSYEEDTFTFKNFEIKETMEKIKEDEEKHIKILLNIIKVVNKNQ
jgi:rubrerythrin